MFLDLKKTYQHGAVPYEALWMVLGKLGLLELLVKFSKSFHPEMEARLQYDRELLDRIELRNGLKQGVLWYPPC